jgi:hypothetical protein
LARYRSCRAARLSDVAVKTGSGRFSVLEEDNGTGAGADPINDGVNLGGVSPELDMLPMGATRNTWPNIVRNKKNVIFCATQFAYIDNRERCIQDFVKGPLLN